VRPPSHLAPGEPIGTVHRNTIRPGGPAIALCFSISSKPDRRGDDLPATFYQYRLGQEFDDDNRPDSGTQGAVGLWECREPGSGVAPSAGDPVIGPDH
jgi:hypothetical protein